MKLSTKQIMLILMSTLLVLVVVMGCIVFNRVSNLLQMSVPTPSTGTTASPSVTGPSQGSSIPESSVPVSTVEPHDHEFVKNSVIAPSCTSFGYTMYTCFCGKADIRDYVDALGHKYGEAVVVNATCEEDGYTEQTCSRCKQIVRTTTDKTGHKFGQWADIETADGSTPTQKQHTCLTCGMVEIQSLDAGTTWSLRKYTLEDEGRFAHYRVVVVRNGDDTGPTYDIYTDLVDRNLSFDYSAAGLTVSYKIGILDKVHTAPATGKNVLTLYVSGKVTDTTPEDDEPSTPTTPDSSTATGSDSSAGTSESTDSSTPAASDPSVPQTTGPSASETTDPNDSSSPTADSEPPLGEE